MSLAQAVKSISAGSMVGVPSKSYVMLHVYHLLFSHRSCHWISSRHNIIFFWFLHFVSVHFLARASWVILQLYLGFWWLLSVGRVVRDKSTSLRVLFRRTSFQTQNRCWSSVLLEFESYVFFWWHLLASLHACWAHAAIVFQILFASCRLQMFMLLVSVLDFAMLSETDIVGAGVPPDVSPCSDTAGF